MKSLHYPTGEPVRLGDMFQAPRWGSCVVTRIDRKNAAVLALNIMTGEEFDDLGQATFSESDLIRRKPENITRARLAHSWNLLRRQAAPQ